MPGKKKSQKEGQSKQAKGEVEPVGTKVKIPKTITIPMKVDDKRKEIDDIEYIARIVNIKHNSPGIKSIKKVVNYDYATKKIEGYYEIETGK